MHYVELYMKKDRDFHLENDLWPFDDEQRKFPVEKWSLLFHQAVHAAKEEARTGLSDDITTDVENPVAVCMPQFLRNIPCSSATRDYMQLNAAEVDFAPPNGLLKSNLISAKSQNKDLNSQDEFCNPEYEPLDYTVERKVLKGENAPETRSGTSPLGTGIRENTLQLDQTSESSLHPKPSSVLNNTSNKKMPLLDKVFEPKMSPELESLNKNMARVTPNRESNLDNSVRAKIPKVENVSLRRKSSRKHKKHRFMNTRTCDQTIPVIDLTSGDPEFRRISDKETVVNDKQIRGEQTTSSAAVEEQLELKAQGFSNMMLSSTWQNFELVGNASIGFLGLGRVGKKIVRRLLADGHEVTLWNRTLYKTVEMVDIGAFSKSTAEEVVNACDIIFCCLSDTSAVKEVFYAQDGILAGMSEGKILVLLTTIEPKMSSKIEMDLITKGGLYIEVPMFLAGGLIINNALMAMAAGSRSVVRTCVPYFRSFIKDVFFVGTVPDANVNMVIMKSLAAAEVAALAEAMALAKKIGLPLNILFQIIKQSDIASPFLLSKARAMLYPDTCEEEDILPISHFSNDLSSTLNISNDLCAPVLLFAATKQVFVHAKRLGYGDHDVSAVYLKYTESF